MCCGPLCCKSLPSVMPTPFLVTFFAGYLLSMVTLPFWNEGEPSCSRPKREYHVLTPPPPVAMTRQEPVTGHSSVSIELSRVAEKSAVVATSTRKHPLDGAIDLLKHS